MISRALAGCGELHVADIGPKRADRDAAVELSLGDGRVATQHSVAAADTSAWLASNQFDVVVAGETALAPYVHNVAGALRVVNANDVESVLWREFAARAPDDERAAHLQQARTYDLIERSVLPQLDQVWVVSPADAATLAARAPDVRCHVLPNVVDVVDDTARRPEHGHAMFFGSLWWGPNQEAVRELLRVSDALDRRGQPHRITVAGAGAPPWLVDAMASRSAIDHRGFVPDLADLLATAAAAVMPMTYGGGSMVKFIDALAHGCPVVTTPEGARGFPDVVDGVHALIRPLDDSFTAAVAAVLRDPDRYERLGTAGRSVVQQRYAPVALDAAVSALIS
jgi:glycosyltransferase involved in cell wall biosynthesis